MSPAWQLDAPTGHSESDGVPAQDDSREQQMVSLFNLTVPADRGRSDVDAYLKLAELAELLPFELKSTTGNSVSTVRDFGPEHIAKWRDLHWIFAFYEKDATTLRYCYYASPDDMREWILDKERYIRPDMVLANRAAELITDATLVDVLGSDHDFGADAAKLIMKNQWSAAEYKQNADLPGVRYSRGRLVALLQERLGYVIRRGATLNNPHISESYFTSKSLQRIGEDHAATVRSLVRDYLSHPEPEAPLDPIVAAQASAAETAEPTA